MELQKEFNLKTFLIFSLPITFQIFLRNLIGLSDNFMVGILGPNYLAGLKIATSYYFFFIILIFAISNAGSVIASQLWGKKDLVGFKKSCGVTIFICTLISSILALVMFFGSDLASSIMIADKEVIKHSSAYLKIISIAFVFAGFNMGLSISFTASGNTKSNFYQQILSTVLNIILNYLLIFGKFGFPKLGVAGAAIASVISIGIGTIFLIFLLIKDNKNPVFKDIIIPEAKYIKEIVILGLPILVDMFFWQFAMMIYLKLIGMGGASDIAIYGVIGMFFSILFITVSGFVAGTGILVGQLIGATLYEEAFKFAKKSLFYSIIFSFVVGGILISLSFLIPSYFKLEGSAYFACTVCLIILGLRQAFATTNGVVSSIIKAGKDAYTSVFITISAFVCVGLPATILAGPVFKTGIIGIFIAISLEEATKAIFFYLRLNSKKWIKITKEDKITIKDEINQIESEIITKTTLLMED
ncbi:MAG: hypothetical protein A2086_16575 [Spirochaetes bacterium GWD1_27_9]|nr:MAG: hypothetical protein A2Z98_12745 [Spirochaetes bacterium GWB1_27_13]OHD28320.1 MAG: hypothetical protein A2Y34_09915 [Spirochaetes bacterium GWC1_27_15]OHD29208.1 MAG: hypothetical protein A2086_16575 [Spirochaetes bacterium GWD1_27_9]